MFVKEVASLNVKACGPDTDLAGAAKIMWDCDCGVVPVVDEGRRVVGVLTDRDICIAAATRGSKPSDVPVRDVMSRDVATCRAGDDLHAALNTMKAYRVRRLPVLDADGRLAGIVSLNDLVLRADGRPRADVPADALLETLRSISTHTRVPATA